MNEHNGDEKELLQACADLWDEYDNSDFEYEDAISEEIIAELERR